MGALHAGHRRLIEECRALTDTVVVSIFVNPTQFGPHEDFERYPRPLDDDLALCRAAGADIVFAPSAATVYPGGAHSTFVEVPAISDILEGASRPGHFRGVATVVLKLFEIVRPDLAVFGRKDYQQQVVIRRMVEDLHVPSKSSPWRRSVSRMDWPSAAATATSILPSDKRPPCFIARWSGPGRRWPAVSATSTGFDRFSAQTIESEVLARLDYGEVVDADTFEPLDELTDSRRAVALIAAFVGSTRLLDNLLLTE